LGYGEPPREVSERARVVAQHRATGAARGGERDLRGDERVAVAVAPDPAAHAQRRDGGEPPAELVLERLDQSLAHARRGLQEAVFEIPQSVRHLVHDRWAVAPHFL